MEFGSPERANPKLTNRVLAITNRRTLNSNGGELGRRSRRILEQNWIKI